MSGWAHLPPRGGTRPIASCQKARKALIIIMIPFDEILSCFSKREVEILILLAEGRSSKEVANHLSISRHTVDTHRRNMIRKTGARRTAELVYRLYKENQK